MVTSRSAPESGKLHVLFVKAGRLRPVWQLVLYLPVLAAAAIALSPIRILGYLAGMCAESPYDIAGVARRTISVGTAVAAIVVGTWAWQRFIRKRDMASLGLSLRPRWLSELGMGILMGIALTGLMFVVALLAGWIQVQGWAWQTRPPREVLAVLYLAVISTIKVAVGEEIMIRGCLLQTLEEWIGLPAAVVISSSLFGLLHLIDRTAGGWANYVIPFTLTLAGLLHAAAYLLRRSLWIPIGLHFAWNLFEYDVFALTEASPQWATVLVTKVTGPAFWVGLPNSAFGPEVGALGVLAMLLGISFLWWLYRLKKLKSH